VTKFKCYLVFYSITVSLASTNEKNLRYLLLTTMSIVIYSTDMSNVIYSIKMMFTVTAVPKSD